MSIQLLSKEIIDQIAAGEVVERPAHMLKELLENSFDAGAANIEIDFSEGGKNVSIRDDGHGITAAEMSLAVARHATSKITLSEDLWKLRTYGFRGEALASIAAISDLTLVSKPKSSVEASSLRVEFGKNHDLSSMAAADGTSIRIRNLFANVPARLKFLKSDSAENTQIKQTLKALALSHPHINFRIKENGELIYYWPNKESFLERAQQVLQTNKLFFCENRRADMHLQIVFSSPEEVTKNSRSLWLFAQNRWITDKTIQAAVMDAYRNLLMHGEYPILALWLDCDPAEVDVNVHPTKSQVKFTAQNRIFSFVTSTLRDALQLAPWQPKVTTTTQTLPALEFQQPQLNESDLNFSRLQYAKKELPTQPYSYLEMLSVNAPQAAYETSETSSYWSKLEVIGQAVLTYVITQSSSEIIFVDQHAAHERVLFERLMRHWQKGDLPVQVSLLPLHVDLQPEEVQAICQNLEALKKIGIEIEQAGPQTLAIMSSPAFISEKALVQVISDLARELTELGGSFALEKKIGDIFASMACHTAIRAGQAQSVSEMQALLRQMDEFPLSGFCPHGRPVSVRYSIARLEREFGRIV